MRPVHYRPLKQLGIAGDPPLCFSHWPSESVATSGDSALVTCKRCIKLLAFATERRLLPPDPVVATATGKALDALAANVQVTRWPGEPDAELRARLTTYAFHGVP